MGAKTNGRHDIEVEPPSHDFTALRLRHLGGTMTAVLDSTRRD